MSPRFDEEALRSEARAELRGREAYGGVDLSATTDLTCTALFFPEGMDELEFEVDQLLREKRERTDR